MDPTQKQQLDACVDLNAKAAVLGEAALIVRDVNRKRLTEDPPAQAHLAELSNEINRMGIDFKDQAKIAEAAFEDRWGVPVKETLKAQIEEAKSG